MIRVKRAYAPPAAEDGSRFLVDGLWPRGIKKEDLQIDGWPKGVAPSAGLRTWFGHDPTRWESFLARYSSELEEKQEALEPIRAAARLGNVTLVYGARDEEHNNAVALKTYLEQTPDLPDATEACIR
ncbi:MAG TPA: DUF488 family protein [Anaerolineae bacterium]|nr:DUF488 family protein [Anaerolineae bacterium]